MPAKQNLGRDLLWTFTVNGQVIKSIGYYTDTHFQPKWTERQVTPTNNGGITIGRAVFMGIDVTLTYMRVNGAGDNLAQFLMDNYIAGNPDVVVTLQETVRNDDGSVDQYIYLDGYCFQPDAGSFKGAEDVSQSFKFFFSTRQQLTGGAIPTISGNALTSPVLSL